jgi:hypothetical protein
MESRAKSNREGTEWKVHGTKIRESLGEPSDTHPWTSKAVLRGTPQKSRVKDYLDLASLMAERDGEDVDQVFIDTSVSVELTLGRGALPRLISMTRNTSIYSFKVDRSLVSEELAGLLGMNAQPIRQRVRNGSSKISDFEFRELLANTMCLPHISAIMLSIVLNIPGLFR